MVIRKLERYQNDSSFTSNFYTSTGKEEYTASSRLICAPPPAAQNMCMKFQPLLKADEGVTHPTLTSLEITSIMTRLRKGSTSSKGKVEESNETSVRSPSTSSSSIS